MKYVASIATGVATLALSTAALAGSGGSCHFHGNAPVKESILTGCAIEQKNALVGKGKIDASWKAVKLEKAETVAGKSAKEWKFTFKNPTEKETSKQTLYVFYTLTGNFIGANFDGK